MKTVLHKSHTRGHFNHGWLRTSHSFSFADYYDPQRMNFGALRVLNDDSLDPGTGFDMHTHHNMEIISIPLSGALEHRDSLGNTSVLHSGEIQVMSAGTGIRHSEYNANHDQNAEFLQIWIIPDRMNVQPRYENAVINDLARRNEITPLITPYPGKGKGLWIYQQAWFSLGIVTKGTQHTYRLQSPNSFGVYIFVIEGEIVAEGTKLSRRDGQGIYETETINFEVEEDSKIWLIEVPPLRTAP